MNISSRQFKQLTEMGISLWQSRQPESTITGESSQDGSDDIYQKIDLTQLVHKQCFNDILQAMNLSIGEIKSEEHHLNLGLFNWSFPVNNTDEITYIDNILCTPEIDVIANSPVLKMQLWHTLNTQIL
jgi:DNA polymerase III psi subunit